MQEQNLKKKIDESIAKEYYRGIPSNPKPCPHCLYGSIRDAGPEGEDVDCPYCDATGFVGEAVANEDVTFGSKYQDKFESFEWLWNHTNSGQRKRMLDAMGYGADNTIVRCSDYC